MRFLFPALGFLVIALDAWLFLSGRVSGAGAVAFFLGVEATVFAGYLLWCRRRGVHPLETLPLLRYVRVELHAWADLSRLLRRRTVVPEGTVALHARRGWWQLPAAFTAAIGIEIIAVELLVPWLWLRLLLLVTSLYSIVLLWGVLAGRVVHPHHLGGELVLRQGREEILRVPVDEIGTVRSVRGFEADTRVVRDGRLTLGGPEGTNVEVVFTTPQDGVDSCALWLDDATVLTCAATPPAPAGRC